MSSNVYTQHTVDGAYLARRSRRQGRKAAGLAKPELFRLYAEDQAAFIKLQDELGYLFNKNEFVRTAVHNALCNSVYTELLKH